MGIARDLLTFVANCLDRFCTSEARYTGTDPQARGGGGGGVLRYISDGDVRSPFFGLKFAIRGLFWGFSFLC